MLGVHDLVVLSAVGAATGLAALAVRRDLALPLHLALPGLIAAIGAGGGLRINRLGCAACR